MISIIICSRHSSISASLDANIKQSIGIPYEIICIDNSSNQYNISQAYNEGVRRAKYEYLCFIHEDILFRTDNWGELIINEFQDSEVGMLGVLGGHYFDHSTMYWFSSGLICGQNLQHFPNKKNKLRKYDDYPELGYDVIAADGMFLAMKKSMFTNKIVVWDETTFSGFHFYDMDMSMQINQIGLKIRILSDLLVEHFSDGNFSDTFYCNRIVFQEKWGHILPVMSDGITQEFEKIAKKNLTIQFCKSKINENKSRWRLSLLPYKIASKLCLSLGYKIW